MNSSAASSTEESLSKLSVTDLKNPDFNGNIPWQELHFSWAKHRFCSLIQVRSNRQQTRRRDVLTELKVSLETYPVVNRSVLARLPSTPVTLVLKDYIPGCCRSGHCWGHLNPHSDLCQKINQSRQQSRRMRRTSVKQGQSFLKSEDTACRCRAKSQVGVPGIDVRVVVSSLVVVAFDVFGAFVFALVISLLDCTREDGAMSTARGTRTATEKRMVMICEAGNRRRCWFCLEECWHFCRLFILQRVKPEPVFSAQQIFAVMNVRR